MKRILIDGWHGIVKSFGECDENRNIFDGVSVEITDGEFVSETSLRVLSTQHLHRRLWIYFLK